MAGTFDGDCPSSGFSGVPEDWPLYEESAFFNAIIGGGLVVLCGENTAPREKAMASAKDKLRGSGMWDSWYITFLGGRFSDTIMLCQHEAAAEHKAINRSAWDYVNGEYKRRILFVGGVDFEELSGNNHNEGAMRESVRKSLAEMFAKWPSGFDTDFRDRPDGHTPELRPRLVVSTNDEGFALKLVEEFAEYNKDISKNHTPLPAPSIFFLKAEELDDDSYTDEENKHLIISSDKNRERYILNLFAISPYRMYKKKRLLHFIGNEYDSTLEKLAQEGLLARHVTREGNISFAMYPSDAKHYRENPANVLQISEYESLIERVMSLWPGFVGEFAAGRVCVALMSVILNTALDNIFIELAENELSLKEKLSLLILLSQTAELFLKRVSTLFEYTSISAGFQMNDMEATEQYMGTINTAVKWMTKAKELQEEIKKSSTSDALVGFNLPFFIAVANCAFANVRVSIAKFYAIVNKDLWKACCDSTSLEALRIFAKDFDSHNFETTLYEEARDLLLLALDSMEKLTADPRLPRHKAKAYSLLIEVYLQLKEFSPAEQSVQKAEKVLGRFERNGHHEIKMCFADIFYHLANGYREIGNTYLATRYLSASEIKLERLLSERRNPHQWNQDKTYGDISTHRLTIGNDEQTAYNEEIMLKNRIAEYKSERAKMLWLNGDFIAAQSVLRDGRRLLESALVSARGKRFEERNLSLEGFIEDKIGSMESTLHTIDC